jgi:hypothetical protein
VGGVIEIKGTKQTLDDNIVRPLKNLVIGKAGT